MIELPRIQRLSTRLANQIAAGEVVERPASVIKELLENSLDAGASHIDIQIERGGVQKMVVTDDGCGIHADDLPLALARHATSKIRSSDDLFAIASLGFRGEALASIASVARLSLSSRARGAGEAWCARAEGADMAVTIAPSALAEGTRVEISDLFFNTPARRRFLRSEATELAHIEDVLRRQALAHPHVAFSLRNNGKTTRQWRLAKDPRSALAERAQTLLGRTAFQAAQAVEHRIGDVAVSGWVVPAALARLQADTQFVFVNGRAVRDRVIAHALREGYAGQLQSGQAPVYALFIDLPASEVDVNVHPTKHEVRFRNARWMHDLLTESVRTALGNATAAPPAESSRAAATTLADGHIRVGHDPRPPASPLAIHAPSPPPRPAGVQEVWPLYREPSATPGAVRAAPPPPEKILPVPAAGALPVAPGLALLPGPPARLLRLAPLFASWLKSQWWQAQERGRRPLLFPQILQLSPEDLQALAPLGFASEGHTLLAAPAVFKGFDWNQLLPALLDELPFDAAVKMLCADPSLRALPAALAAQPGALEDPRYVRIFDEAFWLAAGAPT